MAPSNFAQSTHRLGWEMIQHVGIVKAATLSPLSATIALAMVAGAATPEAEKKFQAKLGVKNRVEVRQSCGGLLSAHENSNESALALANALFYEPDMSPTAQFMQYLNAFNVQATQYPKLADSVNEINAWVAENTGDLIPNLLTRAALRDKGVALINALVFKGTWVKQFNKQKTVPNYEFRSKAEQMQKVDMMFQPKGKMQVAYEEGYIAVSLPYQSASDDTKMSLIAYLPDEDVPLETVVQGLAKNDTPQFNSVEITQFGFPRFEIETGVDLKEMLRALDYPVDGAFPGLNGVIGAVIHRAIVKLDEEGTVAAAATAVLMTRSRPKNQKIIIFDRPFAFSIKIDKSDIVVFTGVFTKD